MIDTTRVPQVRGFVGFLTPIFNQHKNFKCLYHLFKFWTKKKKKPSRNFFISGEELKSPIFIVKDLFLYLPNKKIEVATKQNSQMNINIIKN